MPTTRLHSAKTDSSATTETRRNPRTSPSITGTRRGTTRKWATGKGESRKGKNVEGHEQEVEDAGEKEEKLTTEERVDQKGITESGTEEPPAKKRRGRTGPRGPRRLEVDVVYQEGVIERGHVYFFFRPKVQLEEAESLDDVRNLHMLLVPRPPEWLESIEASVHKAEEGTVEKKEEVQPEMKVFSPGADVIPSEERKGVTRKHYRLITIGKKHLPTEELMADTPGRRRPVFWGLCTAVGDDLEELEKGLGERTYETKTRGTRREAPARLAARGVYAIVNRESPSVPSKRESHLAYRITHPSPGFFGDVQHSLGIVDAAAFVLQVKNPLAPPMTPQQSRTSKKAEYPEELMRAAFGTGTGGKGRHDYGLRFASCETPQLLDYKGAELLFIAAREGQEGLEESIGEERGRAMKEAEEKEEMETVDDVFEELGFDMEKFPAEALKGEWI